MRSSFNKRVCARGQQAKQPIGDHTEKDPNHRELKHEGKNRHTRGGEGIWRTAQKWGISQGPIEMTYYWAPLKRGGGKDWGATSRGGNGRSGGGGGDIFRLGEDFRKRDSRVVGGGCLTARNTS